MLSRADAVYFISICQASFMQDIDDQALTLLGQYYFCFQHIFVVVTIIFIQDKHILVW